MREISAPLTDTDTNLHLVFLENGTPKLETMSVVQLTSWQKYKSQTNIHEVAGVFLNLANARAMVNALTNGSAIFIPQD